MNTITHSTVTAARHTYNAARDAYEEADRIYRLHRDAAFRTPNDEEAQMRWLAATPKLAERHSEMCVAARVLKKAERDYRSSRRYR